VPKTYLAEVSGIPGRGALRRLREGVELEDGRTAPARARLAQTTPTGAALEIIIHEGRNRQVRRMCEAIGHPVRRLVRTRFGPLVDHRLAPGQWRPLTQGEIRALYAAIQTEMYGAEGDSGV
jgi:23S rRNA pseudouridine2605 synthase